MDNKYYKIKVVQEKNEIPVSKDKIDLSEFYESLSFIPVTIKLIEEELDDETEKVIAYINGYFFDYDYIFMMGASIFDVLDMISGDTYEIYDVLFEDDTIKPEYESFHNNFFYIDRLYVDKEYRNQGYATMLLKQTYEILLYMAKLYVGTIIVCAEPYEIKNGIEEMLRDDKELKQKLTSLYEKAGFKKANGSFGNYLIKVIEPI